MSDPADHRFPCGQTLMEFATLPAEERVVLARTDRMIFAYYYLSKHFEVRHGFPPCLTQLFAFLDHEYTRACVEAWRGFGKSAILSLAEVLHEVYYGKAPYVLLLSQSFDVIKDNHDTIRRELADNERLGRDFGAMKPVIDRRIGGNESRWEIGDIITTTGCRIRSRGMKQRVRGTKFDQFRPHLVVADDPEDETNTRTPDEMKGNLRWLNKSVVGALDPDFGRILVSGNIICPDCLVHTVSRSRFWKTYHLDILQADGITPTWPQRFSADWIKEKQAYFDSMGDYDAFDWEFRNKADSPRRQAFQPEDARFWEGDLTIRDQFAFLHLKQIGAYAAPGDLSIVWEEVDELLPATVSHGKDVAFTAKAHSDMNVDVIVATDAEGRRFVVEVDEYKEASPTRVLDHTFAQFRTFRPDRSGIETHHGQVYLAVALTLDPRWEELKKQPAITRFDHEDENKEARIIGTMQPLDHAGKLLFKKSMRSAIEQRRQMPHHGRGQDDVIDAIEMAVAVSQPPPEMTIHEWACQHQPDREPVRSYRDVPRPWMIV